MKLNNKKTGIACMIGVAVLASSCSDWLDPKPLSFYTPEISFADYNGLKTGTDMLNRDVRYFDFYPTSGSADPCILSEYFFSDISVNGRTDAANSPQDLVRQITPSASLTGNASQINNYWTYLYKGIKDANTLLTRSETAEFDNEDQRKEIEGLACFHRAYRYYRLVNQYGDIPFITEEIYCTLLPEEESIMISKWPEYSEDRAFPAEEKAIETIKEAVRGIRNIRTEMNVAPSRKASVYVVSENDEIRRIFEEGKLFFASLAYANEIMIQADKAGIADDAVSVVIPGATLYIPFAELVDIAQEIERLKKEQKRLEGELARSRGMLSNERFLSKAPEAKIAEEKEKLAKYEQMMEQVTKRLEQLA